MNSETATGWSTSASREERGVVEELCLCGERAGGWRREPASAGQETGGHYGSTGTVQAKSSAVPLVARVEGAG